MSGVFQVNRRIHVRHSEIILSLSKLKIRERVSVRSMLNNKGLCMASLLLLQSPGYHKVSCPFPQHNASYSAADPDTSGSPHLKEKS